MDEMLTSLGSEAARLTFQRLLIDLSGDDTPTRLLLPWAAGPAGAAGGVLQEVN